MYPQVILSWPGLAAFEVESYPLAHLGALLVQLVTAVWLYRRDVARTWAVLDPFLVGVPAGLVGARLLGACTAGDWPAHFGLYGHASWWWAGSKSAYGGLLAGGLAAVAVARLRGLDVRGLLGAAAPGLALGACIARVGCFLAGCCAGTPTSSIWAVRFPDDLPAMRAAGEAATGVHPTQLYLAAAALVIALVSLSHRRSRPDRPGERFVVGVALYAATVFAVEFVRGDTGRWFGLGLSHNQWISAGLLAVCAVIAGRATGGARRHVRALATAGAVALAIAVGAMRASADEGPADADPDVAHYRTALRLLAEGSRDVVDVLDYVVTLGGGRLGTYGYLGRGVDALLRGDLPGAVAELERAGAVDPGTTWSAEADVARGIALLALDDASAALGAFTAATDAARGDTLAYSAVMRGRLLAARGDVIAAEESFRLALAAEPRSRLADDATRGLAESLLAQRRFAEARTLLADAARRFERRGFYMVPPPDRRLGWDRLARQSPAALAAALRARAARALDEDGAPVDAVLAAVVDRDAGPELARLRRRLPRLERRARGRDARTTTGDRCCATSTAPAPLRPGIHRAGGTAAGSTAGRAPWRPWWIAGVGLVLMTVVVLHGGRRNRHAVTRL